MQSQETAPLIQVSETDAVGNMTSLNNAPVVEETSVEVHPVGLTVPTTTTTAIQLVQPKKRVRKPRPKKLKVFTVFNKLPSELRCMIFVYLLPKPDAIHEAIWDFFKDNNDVDVDRICGGFQSTNRTPTALLRVNKESRALALKHYTPVLARRSVVKPIGSYLLSGNMYEGNVIAGTEKKYPHGHIITEDMVEVRSHTLSDDFLAKRGVLIEYPARSFFNLKNDILYFNSATYNKHPIRDYDLWVDIKRSWSKEFVNSLHAGLHHLSVKHAQFTNLNTLTLVFYDTGHPDMKEKTTQNTGPITFTENEDIGPMTRRKGGRVPGPFEAVARVLRAPTPLPTPAAVLAEIELRKTTTATEVLELKKQKPEMNVPEIKWRFARRNGKFKQR
ncbi:hypothetical protein VTL71DRAFT_3184 [Oculimacula yallundae]|uniref:2EXR domain-containing protein n=1 Tax=Oculimacula yallundae TaxID=86028 RepID=A0ABR4C6E3_9HELO